MGRLKDNILGALTKVMFPENFTCELCGREIFDDSRFCERCREEIVFNNGATCSKCGRKTKVSLLCLDCKDKAPLYDKAVSALSYSEGVQKLIISFKEGKTYLKRYFADLVAEKCKDFTDAEAVCFVPMTAAAERRRGYNQSQLLAKELAKRLNLPLLNYAVVKVKNTASQKSLTKRERSTNLKSVFKADKEIVSGKTLIIVDDVLTTGATAEAMCEALKKSGAVKIYFATVASVEYKGEL